MPAAASPLSFSRAILPLILIICCTLTACGPVHKRVELQSKDGKAIDITSMRLDIAQPESEFTLIDERADTTATSAVLFGIIGAVATAAHSESVDNGRAAPMRDGLKVVDVQHVFQQKMQHMLQEKMSVHTHLPPEDGAVTTDAVLTVKFGEWGLRRRERESSLMVPFIEAFVVMRGPDNKILWDKRDVFIGSEAHAYDTYLNDHDVLAEQMEYTVARAAESIAYQIIYR